MTNYCTQSDLEIRFGTEEILELTDRDADGVMDTGVLDVAIEDAGATIDSYIAKRYDLPISEIPTRLKKIACDLVFYALHQDPPEKVAKDNAEALKFLKDVAMGRAELDIAGNEPESATNDILVDASTRVFTSETLKDF